MDWVLACEPKGCRFDSQSGHMAGLRGRSPVGGAWEATAHWYFPLFLSPFPYPKINKWNLKQNGRLFARGTRNRLILNPFPKTAAKGILRPVFLQIPQLSPPASACRWLLALMCLLGSLGSFKTAQKNPSAFQKEELQGLHTLGKYDWNLVCPLLF